MQRVPAPRLMLSEEDRTLLKTPPQVVLSEEDRKLLRTHPSVCVLEEDRNSIVDIYINLRVIETELVQLSENFETKIDQIKAKISDNALLERLGTRTMSLQVFQNVT